MPPAISSLAKLISILSWEVETHFMSLVARTVTWSGSPSRLILAMSFQAAWDRVMPQPRLGPPRTGGTGLHMVATVTWVTEFLKSTSNSVAPAGGMNCTSRTFMFGGRSRPSVGYAILVGPSVPGSHSLVPNGGKVGQ